MPSYNYCLDEAVKAKRITKTLRNEIIENGEPDVAIANLRADLTRQRRENAIQAVRLAEAYEKMKSHPKGLKAGLDSLLTKDKYGQADYGNIEYWDRIYTGRYHAKMTEMLSKFRTRMAGLTQDKEGLKDLARAIFGQPVEDAEIAGIAKGVKDLFEEQRVEFNRQGGSISKLESYNLPVSHDRKMINQMGEKKWIDLTMPLLDRNKMVDDAGRPLNDVELEELLKYSYQSIVTNGLNKIKPFTAMPNLGKKLSKKHSDQRILHFKDGDSWLKYMADAGTGQTAFDAIISHTAMMAHDSAMMRVLGSNPKNNFNALLLQARREADLSDIEVTALNNLFRSVSGEINEGDLGGLADFMQSSRNVLTASTLGGAFLSSLSDLSTMAITSKVNNLSSMKVYKRMLSELNPANEDDRKLGVRIGLVADTWADVMNRENRYVDTYGNGITAKLADGVMRVSLLKPWTEAGRKAFGKEMSAMLADNFGKKFNELDDGIRQVMSGYGISADDWNKFRKTKTVDHKGVQFADFTTEDAAKFHQMVLQETDYAVPNPDARVRSITSFGQGRNTIAGQMARSVMMLKSFPITMIMTHGYRMMNQSTKQGKIAYGSALFTGATVMGAAALMAKDLAAGREPRDPMDDPTKFFIASALQGGSLGIFGDLFFSDVNRFGGGLTTTLVGPYGELIDRTSKLIQGNAQNVIYGEDTNLARELGQMGIRYMPKVWQIRLFQEGLMNSAIMWADPDYQNSLNRSMRRIEKDYNTEYYWRKGEILPEGLQ